jgi:hypothetical protein
MITLKPVSGGKSMKRTLSVLAVLSLCLAAAGLWLAQSAAAAMVEQTIEQLTANSSDIINGEVLAKESWWNKSETFIFTSVTIQVNELYKGTLAVPSTVTVVVPGGEVGETGLGVEHAPRFEVGQEVIVFLTLYEDSTYKVTAWEQGKYTLEDGQVKEKRISVSSFEDEIRKVLK